MEFGKGQLSPGPALFLQRSFSQSLYWFSDAGQFVFYRSHFRFAFLLLASATDCLALKFLKFLDEQSSF